MTKHWVIFRKNLGFDHQNTNNVEATAEKILTYNDLLKLYPDEARVELIDNEIYEMSAPTSEHQRIVKKIARLLDDFVEEKVLGELFLSPYDVILNEEQTVQPDLTFIGTADLDKVQTRGFFGVPTLLVEVISPSSYTRDNSKKKKIYAEAGVKEYWIVEPANQVVEIWKLTGKEYELHSYLIESGVAQSAILEGFELAGKSIFG